MHKTNTHKTNPQYRIKIVRYIVALVMFDYKHWHLFIIVVAVIIYEQYNYPNQDWHIIHAYINIHLSYHQTHKI